MGEKGIKGNPLVAFLAFLAFLALHFFLATLISLSILYPLCSLL